jgi:dipeptidyl aminopeptidase/acylaminoacyl peptidase
MPELTAEMIVDLAYPQDIQISPDGNSILYTLAPQSNKDEHPVSAIWLATTADTSPAHQFTRGDAQDHTPKWSPDGSQIAFLSDRATRGTAQLYLIQHDGGEARPLTSIKNKRAVEDFAWSPDGSQIAFLSADEPTPEDEQREKDRDHAEVYGERWQNACLRLIDLATRNVTTRVRGERHVTLCSWSPNGTKLAYVACQNPTYEARFQECTIEYVEVDAGGPRVVCRVYTQPSLPAWSNDGHSLFFLNGSEHFEQSSAVAYRIPIEGGEPERIAPGAEQCVSGLLWPATAQRAIVMLREGLEAHICWLNSVTGQLAPLAPTTPADCLMGLAHASVRCLAGKETVVAFARSSEGQPWQVWAGRCADEGEVRDLRQVTAHHSELAGMTWGRQEPFTWTASDGWEMDGVLVLPPDVPIHRPLPLVVLPHGGPYDRSDLRFHLGAMGSGWAQWLALDGYAVLLPNYRGGSGHGERFAAAIRGDVGGADYANVISAVDAAIARGIADPERVGIGGWSSGGVLTAWAVTQTTRFKAAVMGAGICDLGMLAMTSRMPDFQRELSGSAPWDGVEARQHILRSPISYVNTVQTPLLLLHGQNDPQIPAAQGTAFHRILRRRQVPCELVTYPREPHAIGERAHQIDVLQRVRAWFNRWLKAETC